MKIRIAGFETDSVVDGPGIRFVIFTQGCVHYCDGCHNPNTLDTNSGEEYEIEVIKDEIKNAKGISGVTFSGGEPFLQTAALAELVKYTKELGLNVVVYSGYTYEDLIVLADKDQCIDEILNNADILIDGPFIKAQRDLSLAFRGSLNQRVIDLKNTKKEGRVVKYLD